MHSSQPTYVRRHHTFTLLYSHHVVSAELFFSTDIYKLCRHSNFFFISTQQIIFIHRLASLSRHSSFLKRHLNHLQHLILGCPALLSLPSADISFFFYVGSERMARSHLFSFFFYRQLPILSFIRQHMPISIFPPTRHARTLFLYILAAGSTSYFYVGTLALFFYFSLRQLS
jgi:hypothetical protein